MFDKIWNKIAEYTMLRTPTDLEVVLERISNQHVVTSANIRLGLNGQDVGIENHNDYKIGKWDYSTGMRLNYFCIKFGDNNTKCIITLSESNEPLFVFEKEEELKQIRDAVLAKYMEMVTYEKKQNMKSFNVM